eukprot:gnl/MRDRNA2_/MRDRNA2_100890_c0_seq1.p1 gnl/MRDRNA2_/MRDRNA2_100890_c0~~gnl/MRDRNA2_/MRDRNA2_100890_c0_seq1.p1  ORF type:complete len:480 (+),score=83.12 gnl/MRDRNA2_/MRDRNA2_100890_c0_seq1:85-1440(+)
MYSQFVSQGDCLPPNACVWVQGNKNPVPLTNVQPGMQILTMQHSPGNPSAYAPVQGISFKSSSNAVWVRIGLSDGSEVVMTEGDSVLQTQEESAIPVKDLIPGVNSLMVMATRPALVQSISQMEEDEAPSFNVNLEVAGCEKTSPSGGRSVLVCAPLTTRGGVSDAQVTPAPSPVSMESAPLDMEVPKSKSNASGAGQVSFEKNLKLNGKEFPEPWKFPASSVEIPMQKSWGKASAPSVPLDMRYKLQEKNTFLELVSRGGSENSNEEPKIMSWTDERAGLVYGSSQYWPVQPHHGIPSAGSSASVYSQVSGLFTSSKSSDTGPILSDISSEGGPISEMLVVLGGRGPGKKESEVALSEIQQVPLHPITGEITSIGSAGHFCGSCRPCEWMQRGRPCKYGWRCTYCHIIDEHTSFHRKKKSRASGKQPQIPKACSPGAGSLVNSSAYKIAL